MFGPQKISSAGIKYFSLMNLCAHKSNIKYKQIQAERHNADKHSCLCTRVYTLYGVFLLASFQLQFAAPNLSESWGRIVVVAMYFRTKRRFLAFSSAARTSIMSMYIVEDRGPDNKNARFNGMLLTE